MKVLDPRTWEWWIIQDLDAPDLIRFPFFIASEEKGEKKRTGRQCSLRPEPGG